MVVDEAAGVIVHGWVWVGFIWRLGAEGDAVGGEVAGEEAGEESGRSRASEMGVGFEVLADGLWHGAGVETEGDFTVVGG